jgi:uncharacterized protein (DUF3084 family)
MLRRVRDADRTALVTAALAFAALAGWGSFAFVALGSSKEIAHLRAEREAILVNQQQLLAATGELQQVESRVSSTRLEYRRVVQAWSDARGRLGATQQELEGLTKRLAQTKDEVDQTGSISTVRPQEHPAR